MKCLYYVTPTLVSAHRISDDLHEAGINDWFFHIISKDEAGLKNEKLHSSNYFETLDFVRTGFIGANIGFIIGVIAAAVLMIQEPFGPDVSNVVYFLVAAFATLFGAWVGGLLGVGNENSKLRRFHDDIEAGKYLILIYAQKAQEDMVRTMMSEKHPEAVLSGVDRHFINPFSRVRRARRQRTTQ
ncbi:MAG: hypothetical protein HKN70_00080 [Gammaproteobacteria bacterium]|nr:hypothetical protein [Gammaproteobacteria bacterium]